MQRVSRAAVGEFALPSKDDTIYETNTPKWTVDSALIYGITFSCVEAI